MFTLVLLAPILGLLGPGLCPGSEAQPAPCRFPSPAGYLPAAFQRACGQTADAAAGPELLRATGPKLWPLGSVSVDTICISTCHYPLSSASSPTLNISS